MHGKYGFVRASTEELLPVCQDCYCRVQQAGYYAEHKVHVVTLRQVPATAAVQNDFDPMVCSMSLTTAVSSPS